MKKNIHPNYQEVVFLDTTSGAQFLTRSTLSSQETVTYQDGKTYPLVKVEVSSASHPFYTGEKVLLNTGGRIERFKKKYGNKK